jgi:hypothetical protein
MWNRDFGLRVLGRTQAARPLEPVLARFTFLHHELYLRQRRI